MTLRPRSLAGALYRRIVIAVGAIGLVMAALTLVVADRALDREADAQLVTAANVLFALMQDELGEAPGNLAASRPIEVGDDLLSDEDARAFHASADWRMFLVLRSGRPIMRSDTAPPVALIPRGAGFHIFESANGRWRSYGLPVPRYGLLLVVGERLHARHLVIREIVAGLLLPLLALLPITALLLHFTLRSGLASLRRLSGELADRSPHDLSRLDPAAWPRDLSVLIVSLNRLLERVDEALAREQGFTDDAAHQLRTPLAAIRIQTQTVIAVLPAQEREKGRALLKGVERASALVDRMLELARLEGMAVRHDPTDLCDVATSVVAEHALLAARNDVEFDFVGDAGFPVLSDPAILAMALAAVIENAVKHSPPGGRIVVRTARGGPAGATILVTDQGRGIAPAGRDHLFDRFARGSGPEAGSGLGLAIARRAMTLLDGTIAFADARDGVTGLTVMLTIPA